MKVPVVLSVEGMNCASCVGRVERALRKVAGVTAANVNLAMQTATIHGNANPVMLVQAIGAAGYAATFDAPDPVPQSEPVHRDLLIAALLAVPVFVLEMGAHLFPAIHTLIGMQTSWMLQFLLATVVLFWPGRRFYIKGLASLRRLAPDMNSLVAVGTLAAYGYSVIATFASDVLPQGTVNVYYEAAVVIVVLILLGRVMEARAKGRTSDAIRRLFDLRPQTARIGGREVPVAALVTGDVIDIRPGERIPVDGDIIEGSALIDESMITGEPVPVRKTLGASVIGGTVNQSGAFTLRATDLGEAAVLARIIRLVEGAQGAKLPIQSVVDRVTMWFVPAVMAASALTFLCWLIFGPTPALGLALVNSVAVLIIACPCAMGLATPTSVMVGTGRGAELGVLFRGGEALQSLKDAKVVALDKTGTLTEGRPTLTKLRLTDGFDRADVLRLAASVEARSEHPLASVIVRESDDLTGITEFESIAGRGVRALVEGKRVEIGSPRFMRELGLEPDDGFSFHIAIDGRIAAAAAISDPIKATTPAVIATLQGLGLKVVMITGDNERTAGIIAAELGIDEVVAGVLPEGKLDAIRALKRNHGTVAFIGDGINDAPALAEADIGIAIGTGTDVAMEAADVVLMSGSLKGAVTAIALSKATIRNIRQNLFWAFAYNVALIPVAAGVLYPLNGTLMSPIFAAGAMALSSVFVLLNALRLRKFASAVI